MADQPDDDAVLTKPKKARSPAQAAAFEKMKKAKNDKEMMLQVLREQLNGPKKTTSKTKIEPITPEEQKEYDAIIDGTDKGSTTLHITDELIDELTDKKPKPKKEPKVMYESASESEEEVIIVKKKKKKPKKTIIYESESESEEEPVKKTRDTKTQQNSSSKFKVTIPDVKPKGPIYYFA